MHCFQNLWLKVTTYQYSNRNKNENIAAWGAQGFIQASTNQICLFCKITHHPLKPSWTWNFPWTTHQKEFPLDIFLHYMCRSINENLSFLAILRSHKLYTYFDNKTQLWFNSSKLDLVIVEIWAAENNQSSWRHCRQRRTQGAQGAWGAGLCTFPFLGGQCWTGLWLSGMRLRVLRIIPKPYTRKSKEKKSKRIVFYV